MSTPLPLATGATSATSVWTPTFSLATPGTSSFSSANASGYVTKLGNLVYFAFVLAGTPTIGSGSGNVYIDGLPYLINYLPGGTLGVGVYGGVCTQTVGVTYPAGSSGFFPNRTGPAQTQFRLSYNTASGGGDITAAQLTSGTPINIIGSGFYLTA